MRDLRANTQVIVSIGPAVAVGDGFTPVTTLAVSTADEAELLKHGSTTVVDISGATFAAITSMDGHYALTLTTSHTDTEGMLRVAINDDSLILPIKEDFMVLSEAAWDSKYVAKDDGFMDVNVKTVGRADTQETEASNLEAACAAYSATRGLSGTALPAAAADAAGGLPISDAGGLDLDAKIGALTYGTANRVNAQVYGMEAGTVTAAAIATGAIDADAIADNAIDAGAIAADAITAAKIADGAIDAATFAAGAITATVIADGAIDAATFAAGAINAAAVADGAIDRATFAADTGLQAIRSNTAQTGASGSITLDASASAVDDFYNDALVLITGGTGIGQSRTIGDYTGATKVATVSPNWATTPDNTSTFAILAAGQIAGATAPTAAQIRAEIDSNSTQLAAIVADTNELQTDWVNGGRLDLLIDGIKAKTDSLTFTVAGVVDSNALRWAGTSIVATSIPVGTTAGAAGGVFIAGTNAATVITTSLTTGFVGNITGNLSGSVGSVTGAVGSVTGAVGGNVTGSVGSLATQAKADVNAEVLDVLNTDTFAQPGQESPAATTTLQKMIAYLYKAWRNKTTQTSSEYALYADDATTKDQEAAVSDDGTTTTRGEVSTGA